MRMPKALQVISLKRILKDDADKVDVEAVLDPTLHFDENLKNLRSQGIIHSSIVVNRQTVEHYQEEASNHLLRWICEELVDKYGEVEQGT